MNIKCLMLEGWMKKRSGFFKEHFERTIKLGGYKEIEPIIGREGRYKLGEKVWFELDDGTAYLCPDSSMFNYDMMMTDVGKLSETEIRALEGVVRAGLASDEQKELLSREISFRHNIKSRLKHKLAFHRRCKGTCAEL